MIENLRTWHTAMLCLELIKNTGRATLPSKVGKNIVATLQQAIKKLDREHLTRVSYFLINLKALEALFDKDSADVILTTGDYAELKNTVLGITKVLSETVITQQSLSETNEEEVSDFVKQILRKEIEIRCTKL